ncbi:MAG: amino acid dehydrogenase [Flavobacteriales bacterium]|nr:MAG: amino acid dehydrogenase [Flavobacteriales bacterium]
MKSCIVIGRGIIGLCTAYYLQKEGCKVTVLDQTDMAVSHGGASYVNAGYLTPSHIISLAAPGMIAKGLKWMFNSRSPFYIKPRLDLDFLRWAWYFKKSATAQKVERAIPIIKDINVMSKELYDGLKSSGDLGDFQLEHIGLLMLYKNEAVGEAERKVAAKVKEMGLSVKNLTVKELVQLEPNLSDDIKGAIHYECDSHTTPNVIMKNLQDYLVKNDVKIIPNSSVKSFKTNGNKVATVETEKKNYAADEIIIASGAWSKYLTKYLGIKIPLEAGKGYSLNVYKPLEINYPAILMESKVAVTPMQGFTRFAGTMEFSGINHTIRKERVFTIKAAAESYYQNLKISEEAVANVKCGLRPVSPDGLPYIGRLNGFENVTLATGHAMMGWSLGPATGKLVTEIITGKKLSMDLTPFNPNRKF